MTVPWWVVAWRLPWALLAWVFALLLCVCVLCGWGARSALRVWSDTR
jgi:hypothetical protein